MKKKIIIILSLVLVIALSITVVCCVANNDFMKNKQTVNLLSSAIRIMNDSQFRDYDLAAAIYRNAFSNSAKINSIFGENADETLNSLFEKTMNEEFKTAIPKGLYGGSDIEKTIDGVEGKPHKKISKGDLYVGDILVMRDNNGTMMYIKDKKNFVNLSNPIEKVEINKALKSVKKSKIFVVLRPMKIMENYTFSKNNATVRLNDAQKAVIKTAESYLLRGDKVQYADTRLGPGYNSEFRWKTGVKSPEDCTKDEWGYTNCAAFCYDVYLNALDLDLSYKNYKLNKTSNFAAYSESLDICMYKMFCKNSQSYTDEDKQNIKKEIYDILQPADILVVRRSNGNGHAMIYTGNGNIIHSSGSVYNLNASKEAYEASIRRMKFDDYFFNETCAGYIFGSDVGSCVGSFYIVRPLKTWQGDIPQSTLNRVENLSGVMVQKTASHNSALTVNSGEEITYTFEIKNINDKKVKLQICDTVPQNTTYISGAQSKNGEKLTWEVEIPANNTKQFTYKVQVNADVQNGTYIKDTKATVGGVRVSCEKILVANTLLKNSSQDLTQKIVKYQATNKKGLEVVNDIYKNTLGFEPFANTQFGKVFSGSEGVFISVSNGVSFSYTLNSNTKYNNMMVPTLYGGRGYNSNVWTNRTRLPREHNLVVGDVLLRKTLSEEQIFIYAGNGEFYNLTNGFQIDTVSAQTRLETCLSTGNAYVILRPSFLQK